MIGAFLMYSLKINNLCLLSFLVFKVVLLDVFLFSSGFLQVDVCIFVFDIMYVNGEQYGSFTQRFFIFICNSPINLYVESLFTLHNNAGCWLFPSVRDEDVILTSPFFP